MAEVTMDIDESMLAYIDIETLGLDPEQHDIWEVGVIVDDKEYEWQMDVRLERADPGALRINRFYERHARYTGTPITLRDKVAGHIARLTSGRMLVGAVPSFDAAFLERFLRKNNFCPAWSHRLICVETMAAGALKVMPQGLRKMAEMFDIKFAEGERHTALGDARVTRELYHAVMSRA
jgi:DNA polymerase III epsilon subunit-like protein